MELNVRQQVISSIRGYFLTPIIATLAKQNFFKKNYNKKFKVKEKYLNLIIEYFEWNNSSNKNIVQSEVVILPYPNDKTRLVKSSNRIVDSLNLGRFTILSNVSQFSEFENYTYFGKISDGLSWLLHNKDEAIQKTKLGQEYVLENFSLKAICNKWLDIIKY